MGLFESNEWNNTTQGNKFSPHSQNTPRILSTEHEGSVSFPASKRMLSDIKLKLMNFLWSGVGLLVSAGITLADTELGKLPMSEFNPFTE